MAGVANKNFCRFGKTFINLIPAKHARIHTRIQSKMRALFMAAEIFYSPSEIVKRVTYISPSVPGKRENRKNKNLDEGNEVQKKCK